MDKAFIIKQDINFLDKPLWFQNLKHDGLGFVWKDIDGYEYRSGYKVPDKIDILILFYLMSKAQHLDYFNIVNVGKYEILKQCSLPLTNSRYYSRVEDCLKRWKNVAIEFHGTFYDGKDYLTIGFGIIDDYKVDTANKIVQVDFNEKWLLKIKESNFFKYINFEYYKALKRPLSRRLYEQLCKTFKGRSRWSIGLVKLGSKLTLSKRDRSARKGEEEKIYASDVLVAIKPAINEMNRLAEISDIIEKTHIPPEDLFTVSYTITGEKQSRVIHFIKHLVLPEEQAKAAAAQEDSQPPLDPDFDQEIVPQVSEVPLPALEQQPETQPQPNAPPITPEMQAAYVDAIKWLESIPYFAQERRFEIFGIGISHVAARYAGIRKQYEKMVKAGKKPAPGWIYSAFKEGYQFKEEIKKAEVTKRQTEEQKRESHIAAIRKFIADQGGISKVLCRGRRIKVDTEAGLMMLGPEAMAMWDDLDMEQISKA